MSVADRMPLARRSFLAGFTGVVVFAGITALEAPKFFPGLFARRYPRQVAGLVFVDASNSAIHERMMAYATPMRVDAVCLVEPAARLGVLRVLDPFGFRRQRSESAARSAARIYRSESMATLCRMAQAIRQSSEEFVAAPPLPPDVPLTVLIHESPANFLPSALADSFSADLQRFDREWVALQQSFAQRSRRGIWRIVPGSDHVIASSQPHAVAAAVLDVLAGARNLR